MKVLMSLMIVLFLLTGCNQPKVIHSEHSPAETATHNPTAEEILTQDPNADIFQYNEVIYANASNIDWVQEAELTIGDRVERIKIQYSDGLAFAEGMATKLPVGTEVYEPFNKNGPILIVELNGKEIRYLGLIEG